MIIALTEDVAQPAEMVSINQTAGWHWAKTRLVKTAWAEAGWAYGTNWRHRLMDRYPMPFDEPMTIHFQFEVTTFRRRDGHNYAGTVCKWFIDGLVYAGLFEDDSSEHLVLLDPQFVLNRDANPPKMTITIAEVLDVPE